MTKLTTPCLCLPLALFSSTTKVVMVCFAIIALLSIFNQKLYWLYVFVLKNRTSLSLNLKQNAYLIEE